MPNYYPPATGGGGGGTAVTTVAGRTGDVTLAVTDVSGAAPTASPTFTGTVVLPSGLVLPASVVLPSTAVATTQSASDNSTKPATTAYVDTADALKANLASPTFTGHPVGVTESAGNNSTRLSSTAYADAAVAVEASRATTAEGLLAPLASPTLTGTPASTTAAADTNTTQIATTANVVSTAAKKSTLTAKGSVYAASGASTPAELAVGTHLTQRMIADTAAATGLKWVPHVIGLGSDATGITSNQTLADTALTMAIAASEVWVYQFMVFYTAANVTMDVKATVTAPSGATGSWGTVGNSAFNSFAPIGTGSTQLALKGLAASDSWGSPNNGEGGVVLGCRVVCSATPGNVTLQFAQATSDPGALTMKAGSSMIGWRVA